MLILLLVEGKETTTNIDNSRYWWSKYWVMFETASWANVFLSPRRESKSYFSFNKLIFYKCNYKLIVSIAKIINEWGEGKIQGYYINIIYDSQIFSKNRSRYIIILLLLFSSFEKWNRFVGKINSAIIFEKYRRFEVFQENI